MYAKGQKPETHRPIVNVSKSTAHRWTMRGTHIWLVAGRSIGLAEKRPKMRFNGVSYIPEKMPPAEIPGCRFEPPTRLNELNYLPPVSLMCDVDSRVIPANG